jgi:hypothetical protein
MMFELSQLNRLGRKFKSLPANLELEIAALNNRYSQILLKEVIKNASGRPGPNIVTGQYVSKFIIVQRDHGFAITNPSPQTARLEYGFSGRDSMGRVYAQPPFPHMRPALNSVKASYRVDLGKAAIKAWRRS